MRICRCASLLVNTSSSQANAIWTLSRNDREACRLLLCRFASFFTKKSGPFIRADTLEKEKNNITKTPYGGIVSDKDTLMFYHRFKRKLKLPDERQIKTLIGQLDFLDECQPQSIQQQNLNAVRELSRTVHDKSSPISRIEELLQLFEQNSTRKLPSALIQDLLCRLCEERNFKLIISTVVEHSSLQKSIDELVRLVKRNPAKATSIISSVVRECFSNCQTNLAKMFLSQLGEDVNKWREITALQLAISRATDAQTTLNLWQRMKRLGANDAGKCMAFDKLLELDLQLEAIQFINANRHGNWNISSLLKTLSKSLHKDIGVDYALQLLESFQSLQSPLNVDHIAQLSTKTTNGGLILKLWGIALSEDCMTQDALDTFTLAALKAKNPEALFRILRGSPINPSQNVFTNTILSLLKTGSAISVPDEQILNYFRCLDEQMLYEGLEKAILMMEKDTKTHRQIPLPPKILMRVLNWIETLEKIGLPYEFERTLVRQVIRQEEEIATKFVRMRHSSHVAIRALTNHHLRVRRLRHSAIDATKDKEPRLNLRDKYYIGVDFFLEAINAMRARSKKRSDVDALISQIITSLLVLPSPLDAAIILNSLPANDWQPPRQLVRHMVTILIRKNAFRSAQNLLQLNLHKGGYALLWTHFFAKSAILDPRRALMCYEIYRKKRKPTYSMLKYLAIGWSTTPLLNANMAIRRIEYVLQELKRLEISISPAIARAVAYATLARKGSRTAYGRAQWGLSRLRAVGGVRRISPLSDFVNKWYPQKAMEKHWPGGVNRIRGHSGR